MRPAGSVEAVVCDRCGATDVGTGAQLTERGWRSETFGRRLLIFFCLDCRPDLDPPSEGAATIRRHLDR